jgi:hypothetical protein
VLRSEPNIILLVTHDDALFTKAVAAGEIGAEIAL